MRFFLVAFLAFIATSFANDCDTICTDNYEPVCASNGMTFSNECVFRREACLAKLSLTIVKQGACPSFCPSMCTENYEPICATNGKTYSNYCSLLSELCTSASSQQPGVAHLGACTPTAVPCPEMCPMLYQPVCGTNKLTYSNQCMLEREACLTKSSSLTVAHQGACSNADDTSAPAPCSTMCIEVYQPVCGTNGKTYSNECFLRREACLTKSSSLTVASQGACPDVSCPDVCVDSFEPVCASNGVTYSNACELLRAACTLGGSPSALSISHEGPCAPISDCPASCPKTYFPVCGTDGKTHGNPCLLSLAACESKTGITTAYEGPCRAPCPESCTLQFSPVCGSNGRTYSNVCFLNKEACLLKTDVSVLHYGECLEADCPFACTKEYRPVCGSDGLTYGNLCSLNREACLNKAIITVASVGECAEPCPEICPLIYSPVCGSNWKTYSNECALKAEACRTKTEITMVAPTECDKVGCTMKCSKEYKPVCGSDGFTYGNECKLLLASCEKRRPIQMLHEGSCSEADCKVQCPEIYEPLCGTNRQTFSSLCHYDAANCKVLLAPSAQAIGIAHEGECFELAEDTSISWDLLREFDTNDDRLISFEEYLALAAIIYPHASEKLNRKVFEAFDTNKDGVLDAKEAELIDPTTIHQGSSSSSAALALSATVLALVVVVLAAAFVALVIRKRKAPRPFVPLNEQDTPYNPMLN